VKLSESMERLLLASAAFGTVTPGPTRAALMRRGLVHNMEAPPGYAARLTALGRQVRADLIARSES